MGYHHYQPLILRFDGSAWSRSPRPRCGARRTPSSRFATDEVWAVGEPIQRFDGAAWTAAEIVRPGAELVDVAAVGAADIWAVGSRSAQAANQVRASVYAVRGQPVGADRGPRRRGLGERSPPSTRCPTGRCSPSGYKDVEFGRRTLAIVGTGCPA